MLYCSDPDPVSVSVFLFVLHLFGLFVVVFIHIMIDIINCATSMMGFSFLVACHSAYVLFVIFYCLYVIGG